MNKKLFSFLLLMAMALSFAIPAYSQISNTTAYRIRRGTATPATCTQGDIFFVNGSATAYLCGPDNTWTAFISASGITGSGTSGVITRFTGASSIGNATGLTWNASSDITLGIASTTTAALRLAHASSANLGTIVPSNFSAARTFTLPDASGTIGFVAGSNKQVIYNNSGAFGGAAGFEYQSGASPNVSITAQNNAYRALYVLPASDSNTVSSVRFANFAADYWAEFDYVGLYANPGFNVISQTTNSKRAQLNLLSEGDGITEKRARVEIDSDLAQVLIDTINAQGGNTTLGTIPNSSVIIQSSADVSSGGLILYTNDVAPIIFGTGGNAFTNEKGRFDANGLTLGKASTVTGSLVMAVSGSANTQTFRAADTPAASNIFKWPAADPSANQVLTASAPAAGIVTLSWSTSTGMAIGGTVTSGTTGSVLFVGAGPVLAQNNAAFFWDNSNARLGLGTASPSRTLHIFGASSATGIIENDSASANQKKKFWAATAGGELAFGKFTDVLAATYQMIIDNSGNVGINYTTGTSLGATLDIAGTSTGAPVIQMVSASGTNSSSFNVFHRGSNTNSVADVARWVANSSGTAAAGFGGDLLLQLESSTTDSQNAAAFQWFWTTATHGSRTSAIVMQVVRNGQSLQEAWRLGGDVGVVNTPPLRTGGVNSYYRIITPADTGLTASTEVPGIVLGGSSVGATVTRTWSAGSFALQREVIVPAPTLAFNSSSTVDVAATLAVVGPPIAGANATLSAPVALFLQAGPMAIGNGTVPSVSPTDAIQLYAADSAAGASNLFARNELGEVNRLTGLAARNSAQFDKTTDDTLATITGLSRNVEAGRTYAFTAVVQTTANVAGGVKFAVSGTATATAISYEGVLMDSGAVVAQTRATALDTTVCALTTSTAGTCTIRGVIQVNAAGTLLIQFAQNTSDGNTSSVLANQYFQLIPIS